MKKTYKRLGLAWRIIGVLLLVFFIYGMISADTINGTLSVIILGSILLYALISVIIFFPPMLIKFFKKLRKNDRISKRI